MNLARISDHYTNIAASGLELGAFTAFLYFWEARELLWDLIEMLCGARVTSNYVRIGGLKNDFAGWFQGKSQGMCLKDAESSGADVDKLLTKKQDFH